MAASDVSATLEQALALAGLDQATVVHRPRLLSDNVLRSESRVFADVQVADAILDRLVHNAYRLNLKGESMRKTKLNLTNTGLPE